MSRAVCLLTTSLVLGCTPARSSPSPSAIGVATPATYHAVLACVASAVGGEGFQVRGNQSPLRTFNAVWDPSGGRTGEEVDFLFGRVQYSAAGDSGWVVVSPMSGRWELNGGYGEARVLSPRARQAAQRAVAECGRSSPVAAP